jgi:glutathione S-transferase
MSVSVRIHGFRVSTWTRTVEMTCIEKGAAYELVPVKYGSDAHGELHPFRRMPAIEVDGMTLFESLAITGYLDERDPIAPLQPTDLKERTRMRMWMSVCADYLFRDVVRTIPRGRPAAPEELTTARTALEHAETLIGPGPFLIREHLTLADLYLAPQIANAADKAPEVLDELNDIATWMRTIGARTSFHQSAP